MKRSGLLIPFVLISLVTTVSAQTSTTSPLPSPRPNVDTTAPLPGANSYTEDQVRERLMAVGFSDILGLAKDDQGIWRGKAKRDGVEKSVALDYRGNIFQN